jgi:putative ABC transport system permease protein
MLIQDLRYGFRISWKKPGTALVAVLTLAVGVAATTTVFSWIDGTLLRPLHGVADADQLTSFETLAPDGRAMTVSYVDYRDYRDHLKLISGLTLYRPTIFSLGQQDHPVRVFGELVSGNYFSLLGVRPVMGRTFSPDEFGDSEGGYPVAVVGYNLWRNVFHADPRAVGRTILVNRQPFTIVGVAPAEFHGGMSGLVAQIWIPATMSVKLSAMPDWMLKDRNSRMFFGIARLGRGVTLARARAEAAAMAGQLATAYPNPDRGLSASLYPMWQGHFGAQATMLAPLEFLMAVCCVVLLIVCANVANLQLARAMGRQQEFSIRLAVGAGRGRLIRQLLTESLVLAALGSLAGAMLAGWTAQSITYLVPPTNLPIVLHVDANGDVLLFTVLVGVLASLASGIAPALHAARVNLSSVMKESSRGIIGGTGSHRIRGLLVTCEVALALVAIVSAGLFARSFDIARKLDPGFDANGVVVSHLQLATAGYSVADRKLFCRRLQDQMQSRPGIAAMTYADSIPQGFDYGAWEPVRVQGYTPDPRENMNIYRNVVAPGYFHLMRIPLVEGRDFNERDDEKSELAMIVSQTFARRYFGGGEAIGRKVFGWGRWFTVVGVARDSKYHSPSEAPEPYIYVAFRQVYRADMAIALYVRAEGNPNQAIAAIRREVRAMDPDLDVFDPMPLRDFIQASLFPQKVGASLLAVLGLVALALASIGLYSVMSYAISQRTHEIGIRMALGARPADVRGMLVRQGMEMAATGLLAGLAVALAVTRIAAGVLVKVSPTDPLVFTVATLFLATVALAASYVPALRATRIDPNQALREA